MSKYLNFLLLERKPKTSVVDVISKLYGFRLGIIRWYGAWRQYAFFPEEGTIFNVECLDDIQSYIKGLR